MGVQVDLDIATVGQNLVLVDPERLLQLLEQMRRMPVVVMVAITLTLYPLLIIWDTVRKEATLEEVAMLEVLALWSSDTVTCVLHVQLGLVRHLAAQFCQIAFATPDFQGFQALAAPKHAHHVSLANSKYQQVICPVSAVQKANIPLPSVPLTIFALIVQQIPFHMKVRPIH